VDGKPLRARRERSEGEGRQDMGNPLVHFEFMVSDVGKAKEFYGKVFDWKFKDAESMDYVMIDTGKEPGGGMMKKSDETPQFALSEYFQVDDIEETLGRVEKAGGRRGIPKMEIPDMGWWAMFFDPDGIPVMIWQAKS
jgi:predicted enzyme related to lactoylglutathione lyase